MRFENLTNPGTPPADGDLVEFRIGGQYIHDSYDFNLLQRLMNLIPQEDTDTLSKTAFRDLFTFSEQVVIDNAVNSGNLSAEQIAVFTSVFKSFSDADIINLGNTKVIMGTRFFANTPIGTTPGCGLITDERAEQILTRNYGI